MPCVIKMLKYAQLNAHTSNLNSIAFIIVGNIFVYSKVTS